MVIRDGLSTRWGIRRDAEGIRRISTAVTALALALVVAAEAPAANRQVITPEPASQTAGPASTVAIDVRYTTSTGDATLTGLGLRVHYDSRALTFTAATNVLASALIGQQPPQDDVDDLDGDASTDRFVLFSWADFAGSWPGEIPVRLLTTGFTTAVSFSASTTVRFSASSTAAGYGLEATPATITASTPPPEGPPIGEAGPHLYLVPTCGHLKGKGTTQWVTDLVLHTPGATSATVNLFLLKRDRDNSDVRGVTVVVDAGTSLRLADVVLGTFAESSAAGALLIGSTEPILVSSRTFNNAPSGTYGQYVEGFPALEAVTGTSEVRLTQLTKNGIFRTNIGFVSASSNTTPVQVDLHGADGSLLGSRSFSLPPWGSSQETDTFTKVTAATVDDGYAVVRSTSGTARYFVYASVIDGRTGDPITVVPSPRTEAATSLERIATGIEAKERARLQRPPAPPSAPAVERAVARLDRSKAHVIRKTMSPPAPPVGAQSTAQAIFSDGFEGAFPGSWVPARGSSATDAVWGHSTYRKSSGAASIWCAAGGTEASTAGGEYLPNMYTWVIYGPFSLADATAAVITFDYWLRSEQEWTYEDTTWGDPLKWLISRDGEWYHGFKTSGDSEGWKSRTFDLASVTDFTALGQPEVYFALVFTSDVSDQMEGAYVDDVAITTTTGGGCHTPTAPVLTAPSSATSGAAYTVSWTDASPDGTYDLEEATDASFSNAAAYSVTSTSRIFEHTVTSTATYHYRVRATFSCGGSTLVSPWSAVGQTSVSPGATAGGSLWVPGTAALSGLQGSNWRTDLQIHNAGTTRAQYQVALHRRGETTTTPPVETFALDPDHSVRYVNVLHTIFGATGAATLEVTTAEPALIVTSRTYNDQPEGTFGQFVPGTRDHGGVPAGMSARLIQLSQSATTSEGFRTNLGLCNLTGSTISIGVSFHDGDGTLLGTRSYTLRPYESIQRDRVFTALTSLAVEDGFAVLRTDTPGGLFLAFASVADNRSNDPIFIPAR